MCNDPNDCSYKDMCEHYRTILASAGRYIKCLDDDVVPGNGGGSGGPHNPCRMIVRGAGPPQIPRFINICDIVPDPRLECLRDLVTGAPGPITLDNLCRPEIPRCDPRCAIGDFTFGQGPAGSSGDPGDAIAANALLKEEANPMAIDAKGRSAMVIAAEQGDVGIIRSLIDKGADIGKADLRGMPALQAAQLSKKDLAASLIERLGGSLSQGKLRATEPPTLLMVTGPSAKTAPPVQGDKFLSTAQARELKAEGKFAAAPPSLDLRLLLLRKHGSFGPSITGEDIIRMNNFLRKLGPQKGIY